MTTAKEVFRLFAVVKTYLHSTTGEFRLNRLAMLNINRDCEISTHIVLDEQSKAPRGNQY